MAFFMEYKKSSKFLTAKMVFHPPMLNGESSSHKTFIAFIISGFLLLTKSFNLYLTNKYYVWYSYMILI